MIGSIALLLLGGAAWAQAVPGDDDYVLPTLSVDTWRPSVDATRTFSAEDSRRETEFAGRIEGHWMQEPLVWYSDDGAETALVDWAAALNLSAAWGRGPFRIGATAPLYFRAPSDYRESEGSAVGDLSLDGKFSAIVGGPEAFGLAVIGRLTLPSGADAFQLGSTNRTGELGLAADYEVGPALIVANAYGQFVPQTQLEEIALDDQIGARLGVGLALSERVTGSAELLSKIPIDGAARSALTSPTELVIGATRRGDTGAVQRAAVGLGLVPGVGNPAFRVLIGVGHEAPPEALPQDPPEG